MPYCPECGNKVSITDKRCSKCGQKLTVIEPPGTDKSHHNIVFALAIITLVLTIFSISQSINDYSFQYSGLLLFVLILILIDLIGAILSRYYAKPGSIIVLIATFMLILFGIHGMALAVIFSVITVVVAFVLN